MYYSFKILYRLWAFIIKTLSFLGHLSGSVSWASDPWWLLVEPIKLKKKDLVFLATYFT